MNFPLPLELKVIKPYHVLVTDRLFLMYITSFCPLVYVMPRFHLGRLEVKKWLPHGQPSSKVIFEP